MDQTHVDLEICIRILIPLSTLLCGFLPINTLNPVCKYLKGTHSTLFPILNTTKLQSTLSTIISHPFLNFPSFLLISYLTPKNVILTLCPKFCTTENFI